MDTRLTTTDAFELPDTSALTQRPVGSVSGLTSTTTGPSLSTGVAPTISTPAPSCDPSITALLTHLRDKQRADSESLLRQFADLTALVHSQPSVPPQARPDATRAVLVLQQDRHPLTQGHRNSERARDALNTRIHFNSKITSRILKQRI
ncbi:hypothetical protein F443_02998 [Phytophthora nicotianae P1569]|uniref:Uncharacterized protein n=1 Tax=Phytophthora nicotianae P1569 TaxID=1317065 RepID=V9FST3_PHYNI|nr:hypothetical protein F443_02998 [Phytophthora nicotianae P1569]